MTSDKSFSLNISGSDVIPITNATMKRQNNSKNFTNLTGGKLQKVTWSGTVSAGPTRQEKRLCSPINTTHTLPQATVKVSRDTETEVEATYRATIGNCVSFMFKHKGGWMTAYDEDKDYEEKVAAAIMFMFVRKQHESS